MDIFGRKQKNIPSSLKTSMCKSRKSVKISSHGQMASEDMNLPSMLKNGDHLTLFW